MYIFTLCLPRQPWAKPGKDTYFCLIGTIFTSLICTPQPKTLWFKYLCVVLICPFCYYLPAYMDVETTVAVDEVVCHNLGSEACHLAMSKGGEHLA